jgi:ABC-type nitrate/sulfonate/bicarbonate transport system permease component
VKKKEPRAWGVERGSLLLVVLILLGIWELSYRAGAISGLFFPAPSIILETFSRLIKNGKLAKHLYPTLVRVLLGFVIGGGAGTMVGLVMGWSARLRVFFDPLIAAAHPIPKIATLPLIMVLLGIGESSRIAVIAVATFFPMLINTMAGVRQIPTIHFDVARNYGATPLKTFTRVIWPGSLPMILTGVRLALNIALLIAIAVEMVASQEGLGAMIWLAWQTLRTEELYVSLLVISILGILFNLLLQRVTDYLVPWRRDQEM